MLYLTNVKSKSQVFLSDFSFSIVLFLFILGFSFYVQDIVVNKEQRYKDYVGMTSLMDDISYKLLFYKGLPPNWNTSNVEVLGFSTGEENTLNYTKLMYFSSFDYSTSKILLTSQERYEFYIDISYGNGSPLWSYGYLPPDNAVEIYKTHRVGIINQSIVLIEIYVWR